MTDQRGFTFRFAIRMPDGELYRWPDPSPARQKAQAPAEDTMSSFVRDMNMVAGMFGMGSSSSAAKPVTRLVPAIFEDIKQAEALLKDIQRRAAEVGVTHWGGTIVTQLCTPFTPGDPSAHFWPAVVKWMRSQGMEA